MLPVANIPTVVTYLFNYFYWELRVHERFFAKLPSCLVNDLCFGVFRCRDDFFLLVLILWISFDNVRTMMPLQKPFVMHFYYHIRRYMVMYIVCISVYCDVGLSMLSGECIS